MWLLIFVWHKYYITILVICKYDFFFFVTIRDVIIKNMWESRFENLRTLFHLRFAELSLDLGLCPTKTKRTLLASVLRLRPGIRLWRRYARLPLTSKLDALCAAYVNRIPCASRGGRSAQSATYATKNKKPTTRVGFCFWRCRPDLNRRITVLQTGALPLGYCTKSYTL